MLYQSLCGRMRTIRTFMIMCVAILAQYIAHAMPSKFGGTTYLMENKLL